MPFATQSKKLFFIITKTIVTLRESHKMSREIKKAKPIDSEEMVVKIAKILKNGLYLGKMTQEKQKEYEADIIQHVSDSPYYTAHFDYETGTVFVETKYFEPLLCVDVTLDSIYFLPLSKDRYYEPFMKVMEYIWLERKRSKEEAKKIEEEELPKKEIPSFDFL